MLSGEIADLINQLVSLSNTSSRREFLQETFLRASDSQSESFAQSLKDRVVQLMRSNTQEAIQLSELLIYYADLKKNDLHRALGFRAKAQALMAATGNYQQALTLFDEAIGIHAEYNDVVGQALVNMLRIWALANLGYYEQAVKDGEWAGKILEEHSLWLPLATLHNNLALVHDRVGNYREAVTMFTLAGQAYKELGTAGEEFIPGNECNRAMALSNMGLFQEAIEVSEIAIAFAEKFQQTTIMARTQHNLGLTYSMMGRYTDALVLLDQARDTHIANHQAHEAALCELSSSFCLLALRRFSDVLKKCVPVRQLFNELGMRLEEAEALWNQAVAYIGLGRYEDALTFLTTSRQIFLEVGHQHNVINTDLQSASLYYQQGNFVKSLSTAEGYVEVLEQMKLPFWASQARLIAAGAALALMQLEQANSLIGEVLALAQGQNWPYLLYQGYDLLGQLNSVYGDEGQALVNYQLAIAALERLRGKLMIEFRVDFFGDKQTTYERIVDLSLKSGQPYQAFEYVERAKSRALQELLAFRPDLGLHAKNNTDKVLVEEIRRLQLERQQQLKYAEKSIRESLPDQQTQAMQIHREVLKVEQQITALWHKLLVHNADYARDASLWEVKIEPVGPYLDTETLLIEYFSVQDELVVFLITTGLDGVHESTQVVRLPVKMNTITGLLQRFNVNLGMVPRSAGYQLADLFVNAKGILKRLYHLLLLPIRDVLNQYKKLIIVPHGSLHYLPFHALYDGELYLVETYQISYLPASSFLRYCHDVELASDGLLSVGHSYNGRLPYAVEEAQMIAKFWNGTPLLENGATLAEIQARASQCRILHLACHGDFRADNPLFSGLAFEDGWLTTFDIFNMRLGVSLVTLSACQTGRNVIGGGDELLGLTRAFLSAGAVSLVLSLWPVADHSTARLMEVFYKHLAGGDAKGAALRAAQCEFLRRTAEGDETFQHPYFWAPFFLIGLDNPV